MGAQETKNRLAAACVLRINVPPLGGTGAGFVDYRNLSGFESRIITWATGAFSNGQAGAMFVLPLDRQYTRRQACIFGNPVYGIAGEGGTLSEGADLPEGATYPQPGLPDIVPRANPVALQGVQVAALNAGAGGGSTGWLPFGLQQPGGVVLPEEFDPDIFDAVAVYVDDGDGEGQVGPYDVSISVLELPVNSDAPVTFQATILGPDAGP